MIDNIFFNIYLKEEEFFCLNIVDIYIFLIDKWI
ncbi:hypothetical protein Spiro2_000189 [Spirobacillus cienkowskii]